MHVQEVMHCDVKEQNIMLRGEDLCTPDVVIIDLGVAQRASTQRRVIYGTPGYIAPEVWTTKNWVPRSDMFSLGVVLVQMLIGRTGIFTENAKTYREIEEATKSRQPPFDSMPAHLPNLKWLARKLLAKDVRSRPSVDSLLQKPWEDAKKQERAELKGNNRKHRRSCSDSHNLDAALLPGTCRSSGPHPLLSARRAPHHRVTRSLSLSLRRVPPASQIHAPRFSLFVA